MVYGVLPVGQVLSRLGNAGSCQREASTSRNIRQRKLFGFRAVLTHKDNLIPSHLDFWFPEMP